MTRQPFRFRLRPPGDEAPSNQVTQHHSHHATGSSLDAPEGQQTVAERIIELTAEGKIKWAQYNERMYTGKYRDRQVFFIREKDGSYSPSCKFVLPVEAGDSIDLVLSKDQYERMSSMLGPHHDKIAAARAQALQHFLD